MWLLICLGIVILYMFIIFGLTCWGFRYVLADVAWAGGFLLATLISFLFGAEQWYDRNILATFLILLWAVRIGVYLFLRYRRVGEDIRYQALGIRGKDKMAFFCLLQAFAITIIVYPAVFINVEKPVFLVAFDVFAIFLWVVGFLFESVADYQLWQFFAHHAHANSVMQTGLWRFTRHPNYFGESLMWWAFFLLALPIPGGFRTIISPLLLMYLLFFVTGIPTIEKCFASNSDYQAYKKRTSAFFPWFPRAS